MFILIVIHKELMQKKCIFVLPSKSKKKSSWNKKIINKTV